MQQFLQQLLAKAQQHAIIYKNYIKWLKAKKPARLDVLMQTAHHNTFDKVDCLQCANCCRTTSPIFYTKDIERAAKTLRMKAIEFEQKYLRIDEDGDYVLQQSPCAFLQDDNYCSIYDGRPTACREYPHTDRKNFIQLADLTLRNTEVCPAVVQILDEVMISLPSGAPRRK